MYYRSVDRTIKDWSKFDPRIVDMIIELVEEFSAKIVISSTWRFGAIKQLNNELTKSGLIKYLHNLLNDHRISLFPREENISLELEQMSETDRKKWQIGLKNITLLVPLRKEVLISGFYHFILDLRFIFCGCD